MKRGVILFLSTRGEPFFFDAAEHANDDWRPERPGTAAFALRAAAVAEMPDERGVLN